jgi:hypothetical protein
VATGFGAVVVVGAGAVVIVLGTTTGAAIGLLKVGVLVFGAMLVVGAGVIELNRVPAAVPETVSVDGALDFMFVELAAS